MIQKAETYIDKSGKSWLVFYDTNGDSDFDIWTTPIDKTIPNKFYRNEQYGIYIGFETLLFPNGKWGYGYETNCFQYDEKTMCCIANNRAFDTELEALQKAVLHLKTQGIQFKFRDEVLKLVKQAEDDLIPKTLF